VGHIGGLGQVCQFDQVVMRNMGEKYAICFYKENKNVRQDKKDIVL